MKEKKKGFCLGINIGKGNFKKANFWKINRKLINFIIFNRSWNVVTRVGMEAGILNVLIYRNRFPRRWNDDYKRQRKPLVLDWQFFLDIFILFSGSQPSNSSCKATVHYPGQGGGIPFARNLLKPAPSREERGSGELVIYLQLTAAHLRRGGSLAARLSTFIIQAKVCTFPPCRVWARLNSNSRLSRSTLLFLIFPN